MATKQTNRVKISRLRLKSMQTLILLNILLLLTPCLLGSASASADYGDSVDEPASSGGNSDPASSNDDIYDPAQQQQEVEASEKRDAMERMNMDSETEIPARTMHKRANSTAAPTHEHENMSYEEDSSEHMLSEEYDALSMNMLTTPKAVATTTTSTMIPEYVRKAKSESFASPRAAISGEEADDNVSLSDYMEDDEVGGHAHAQHHRIGKAGNGSDGIVPLAMKFYPNDQDGNDEVDNKLKEHQARKQQQALPRHKPAQPFHPNSSEEDYYEDSHDIGGGATATPLGMSTPTQAPTYQPNLAVARAGVAAFPFGRNGAWTTTTTTTTTTTSSTAVEPTLDAAVTPTAAPAGVHTATMATGLSESSAASPLPLPPSSSPSPAVPTTTTTTTTITTTLRPAGKQGKQINISRRKLLPHEQLRNYIEDAYIRMPLAVIVDPSAESLEKTKALWRDALRMNLNIKIVLVSLNASGIPAAYNFNNTRQFLAGLNSIKEHDGGNAFIGIVHASELVPYDSAVFISTAIIPPHTELVQDAAITLLKKRIRLYLIWYGERAVSENETQEAVGGILGEVAIRSGGEILHIVGSENSQELEGSTLTVIADAFRGSQEVDIPVDTTLSSLHVKIDSPMRTATLETPNGEINLKKLVKFKSRILTLGPDDKRLDAYVPLNKLRKATVFKLKMVPESLRDEYSVFVRADRKPDLFLDDMIKRFDSYFLEGRSAYPNRFHDTRLKSITALTASTIPTHDNLRFPVDEQDDSKEALGIAPKTEVETFSETEIHESIPPSGTVTTTLAPANPPNSTVARANIVNQRENSLSVLQKGATKIEMGLQSQLLVAPGTMGQLQFELTNTRAEAIFHNIQVVDERRYLLRLTPQSIFLRAGETAIVSVTVLVPSGTPQGTIDKITFTCHGGGTTSLSLNLKVTTTIDSQDNISPTMTWTFGSRCEYIAADAANCAERFWTLDITAQDWETGIMRLQSTPTGSGLIYRNSYTVGSTEPLKATFIATCCEPRVALTAYDIAGNQRSRNIDVRDIVLTEASIAAIVLGALLLLLLIILLIWAIVWCCRRRKVTLDLPTYRSHSTRSMD